MTEQNPPRVDISPFMEIEEVSEYLRTPVNTLRFWRHKRVGPPAGKFGGRLMYRRSDVEAWATDQFKTAAGE